MNAPLPEGLTLAPEASQDDAAARTQRERKIAFENNKLEKRLHRLVGKAIDDFNMIEDGDRVMVCLSGGKDSYAMLDILMALQRRAPIRFELVAVNLDQKQPGFPDHILPEYFQKLGVPFHIETQDTYSIVKRNIPEGKTLCSLCSRLRRGILYRVAGELKCTKIALGHHRDDILATTFLNMFYGGRMKGMPPKLVSDDGRNIVIRPLAYVAESDLIRNAEIKQYPIIPCNLCGSQENLKRREMINMIRGWEKSHPGRVDNAFNALSRITLSHMLDATHYDFKNLKTTGSPFAGGDIAFDDEPCADPADGQVISLTRFED
ncbi:tRNA 2-thiocytidine biosynthesis protein TtcA [beta proteobacterium AAP99]|nr:tRNA 2-thiocytidine biosynthesis protein TtcA [beta proteobacterium AAP99]